MKKFDSLSKQEILALAISHEEEDDRVAVAGRAAEARGPDPTDTVGRGGTAHRHRSRGVYSPDRAAWIKAASDGERRVAAGADSEC